MVAIQEDKTARFLAEDVLYAVKIVDAHLDAEVDPIYQVQFLAQDWARTCKVIEELGETIKELIAFTGQNPRKGIHSSEAEMLMELGDTAMAAILGIQHFTKDPIRTDSILRQALQKATLRVPREEAPNG